MKAMVFDTETTGLIDNGSVALDRQPEVIEFYGVNVDLAKKGKALNFLHHLIRPQRPFSEVRAEKGRKTITEITGLRNEDLRLCLTFDKVADEVISYIERAPVVIAQNASFDKEMIDLEAKRLNRVIKWPPLVCTVEQSIHYKGHRMNLGDLHEHLLGVRFSGAHRAKEDVDALVRCCVEMRKRGDL